MLFKSDILIIPNILILFFILIRLYYVIRNVHYAYRIQCYIDTPHHIIYMRTYVLYAYIVRKFIYVN